MAVPPDFGISALEDGLVGLTVRFEGPTDRERFAKLALSEVGAASVGDRGRVENLTETG